MPRRVAAGGAVCATDSSEMEKTFMAGEGEWSTEQRQWQLNHIDNTCVMRVSYP